MEMKKIILILGILFLVLLVGCRNSKSLIGKTETYSGFLDLKSCQDSFLQNIVIWDNCGFNSDVNSPNSCAQVWDGTKISTTYSYSCSNQGQIGDSGLFTI